MALKQRWQNQQVKTCSIPFELKAAEGDDRLIEGHAAIYSVLDSQGDILLPGCSAVSIAKRHPRQQIKLLWQHRDPLGLPIELGEDKKGLWFRARVSKTQLGDEALTLIRDRVVDTMSIGFDYVRFQEFEDLELREMSGLPGYLKMLLVQEIDLREISPVTFAANDQTNVGLATAKGVLEDVLEDQFVQTKSGVWARTSMVRSQQQNEEEHNEEQQIKALSDLAEAASQLAAACRCQ